MTARNLYLYGAAALLGATALVGCDVEESACSSDADCEAGFACDLSAVAEGESEGTCFAACTADAQCATGYTCNTETQACEVFTAPGCTTDAECTGGYLCDTAAGACYTSCTDGSECGDGYQCNADSMMCELVPEDPYSFVAVHSRVAGTDDAINNTNTPGPDIDAIILTSGGAEIPATTVEGGVAGSFNADEGNAASDASTVTGARDSTADVTDCDLSGGYYSLGADDGFVIVSFGAGVEMADGDSVAVYELANGSTDPGNCENVGSNWSDTYDVYINNDATAATAADIAGGWCLIGSKAGGGFGTFQIALADCE